MSMMDIHVALLAEGVDRNLRHKPPSAVCIGVALLTEGVDRRDNGNILISTQRPDR